MAKGGIVLDIETNYKDEGLQKLNQGIKQTSTQVKTATEGISRVFGVLETGGNKIGGIFGKLTGLLQGFGQGGVVGVAIAGIGAAFKLAIDQVKAFEQRSVDAAEKVTDKFSKMFDRITQKASNIKSSFGDIADQISTRNVIKSLEGDVQSQKAVSGIVEKGISERKSMSKDYDIQFSKAKQQNDIERTVADAQYRKVRESYDTAVQKTAAKQEQISKLKETQSIAKSNASISFKDFGFAFINQMKGQTDFQKMRLKSDFVSGGLSEDIQKQITESWKKNKDTLKKVTDDVEAAEKELVSLQQKENEAKQKLTIAELQHTTALQKADESLAEATKARNKAIEAEFLKQFNDAQKASDDKANALAKKQKAEKEKNDAKIKADKEAAEKATKEQKKNQVQKLKDDAELQRKTIEDRQNEAADAQRQLDEWNDFNQNHKTESFEESQRAQKQIDKDAKKEKDNLKRAETAQAQLAQRLGLKKDIDGTFIGSIRKSATAQDKKKFEELQDYIKKHSPEAKKALEEKAKAAQDAVVKSKETLEKILGKISNIAI